MHIQTHTHLLRKVKRENSTRMANNRFGRRQNRNLSSAIFLKIIFLMKQQRPTSHQSDMIFKYLLMIDCVTLLFLYYVSQCDYFNKNKGQGFIIN